MNRRLLFALSATLLLIRADSEAAYSPSTTSGWFITSGRVAGVGGSLFRTDFPILQRCPNHNILICRSVPKVRFDASQAALLSFAASPRSHP